MPAAGRVGDKSHVPADSHGCKSCPHSAMGPAVAGSPDVFINFKPALRVGDPGTHTACCGPNTWQAAAGAPGVIINNKPAHRQGDAVTHCGGQGQLIEGSPDVIIGNEVFWAAAATALPKMSYDEAFILVDEKNGAPLANWRYRITRENGEVLEGVTDTRGHTELVQSTYPENLRIEVLEPELDYGVDDEPETFRLKVVDPEGKPLAGKKVTVLHDGKRFNVTLDDQGVALLEGLNPGLSCEVLVDEHGCLATRGAADSLNDPASLPNYMPGWCGPGDSQGC
jgi:uncharacterized Zn-binding protein involved in type VI secretion